MNTLLDLALIGIGVYLYATGDKITGLLFMMWGTLSMQIRNAKED